MKKGNGSLSVLAVLMLFVSVSAGAVSAQTNSDTPVEENPGDIVSLHSMDLGRMYSDGDGNTASVAGMESVTVPAGRNTFTATYSNSNDRDNDGQGAIYRLTAYDALGIAHTTEKKVDRATSGTINVTFDSQGSGDAQYELWCETHDWFDTTMAFGGPYVGDLDFV